MPEELTLGGSMNRYEKLLAQPGGKGEPAPSASIASAELDPRSARRLAPPDHQVSAMHLRDLAQHLKVTVQPWPGLRPSC